MKALFVVLVFGLYGCSNAPVHVTVPVTVCIMSSPC